MYHKKWAEKKNQETSEKEEKFLLFYYIYMIYVSLRHNSVDDGSDA